MSFANAKSPPRYMRGCSHPQKYFYELARVRVPSWTYLCTPLVVASARRRGRGEGTEADPIWLFVEGFILFAEPSLVVLMDELVWLDAPWHWV